MSVFTLRHLDGVGAQVAAGDMVVLTDLGAVGAREVAFWPVRAGAVSREGDLVVDLAHLTVGVARVQASSLIGVDNRAGCHNLLDDADAYTLRIGYEGQRPAASLVDHND